MTIFTDGYRVVLGDDDEDDDTDLDIDSEEETLESKKKATKKKPEPSIDDEYDDDEDIIICPVCGEEVLPPEDDLVEGTRIVCDSPSGCMTELEVTGFDKEHHPKLKVIEDEK